MKKTLSWIVSSADLFNKEKNPKGSWSPVESKRNPKIEKRCPSCNSVLVYAEVYENGQADESLYCLNCKAGNNPNREEKTMKEKSAWVIVAGARTLTIPLRRKQAAEYLRRVRKDFVPEYRKVLDVFPVSMAQEAKDYAYKTIIKRNRA